MNPPNDQPSDSAAAVMAHFLEGDPQDGEPSSFPDFIRGMLRSNFNGRYARYHPNNNAPIPWRVDRMFETFRDGMSILSDADWARVIEFQVTIYSIWYRRTYLTGPPGPIQFRRWAPGNPTIDTWRMIHCSFPRSPSPEPVDHLFRTPWSAISPTSRSLAPSRAPSPDGAASSADPSGHASNPVPPLPFRDPATEEILVAQPAGDGSVQLDGDGNLAAPPQGLEVTSVGDALTVDSGVPLVESDNVPAPIDAAVEASPAMSASSDSANVLPEEDEAVPYSLAPGDTSASDGLLSSALALNDSDGTIAPPPMTAASVGHSSRGHSPAAPQGSPPDEERGRRRRREDDDDGNNFRCRKCRRHCPLRPSTTPRSSGGSSPSQGPPDASVRESVSIQSDPQEVDQSLLVQAPAVVPSQAPDQATVQAAAPAPAPAPGLAQAAVLASAPILAQATDQGQATAQATVQAQAQANDQAPAAAATHVQGPVPAPGQDAAQATGQVSAQPALPTTALPPTSYQQPAPGPSNYRWHFRSGVGHRSLSMSGEHRRQMGPPYDRAINEREYRYFIEDEYRFPLLPRDLDIEEHGQMQMPVPGQPGSSRLPPYSNQPHSTTQKSSLPPKKRSELGKKAPSTGWGSWFWNWKSSKPKQTSLRPQQPQKLLPSRQGSLAPPQVTPGISPRLSNAGPSTPVTRPATDASQPPPAPGHVSNPIHGHHRGLPLDLCGRNPNLHLGPVGCRTQHPLKDTELLIQVQRQTIAVVDLAHVPAAAPFPRTMGNPGCIQPPQMAAVAKATNAAAIAPAKTLAAVSR
ncbi:hypothetical protein BGZ94_001550 [Podila epigama]|nr:hypothetical protein BGZ94_001550 [Podila epigama]